MAGYTQRQAVKLKDLVKKAVPEGFFGPVDVRQRFALKWTGALLGVGLVATFFLGELVWRVADFGFFRPVASFSLIPFQLLASPLGVVVMAVTLILWGCMLWYTDGFVRGKLEWLQAGNGLVAVGSFIGVALTLPLLNFVFSAAIVIVVGALALLILVG